MLSDVIGHPLIAVVLVRFTGMFHQFVDAWQYWKVKTKDFLIWIITFVATLVFDIPIGLQLLVFRCFL